MPTYKQLPGNIYVFASDQSGTQEILNGAVIQFSNANEYNGINPLSDDLLINHFRITIAGRYLLQYELGPIDNANAKFKILVDGITPIGDGLLIGGSNGGTIILDLVKDMNIYLSNVTGSTVTLGNGVAGTFTASLTIVRIS